MIPVLILRILRLWTIEQVDRWNVAKSNSAWLWREWIVLAIRWCFWIIESFFDHCGCNIPHESNVLADGSYDKSTKSISIRNGWSSSSLVMSSRVFVFPISNINWSIRWVMCLFSFFVSAIVLFKETSLETFIKERRILHHHRRVLSSTGLDLIQQNFQMSLVSYYLSSSLGMNSDHFTVDQKLLLSNPSIDLWKFEVIVYSVPTGRSSSALNFVIDHLPGTVCCPDWFDQDEIKDYSHFVRSNDSTRGPMIAFSSVPDFDVYLPRSDDLRLMILIRDRRDCLTSLIVQVESNRLSTSNPFLKLLSSPNQNRVGPVLSSLSQGINRADQDNLQKVISSSNLPWPLNVSASEEFGKDLNRQTNLREHLIPFLSDLPVNSWNTIQIQSKSLVELTELKNQLVQCGTNLLMVILFKTILQPTVSLFKQWMNLFNNERVFWILIDLQQVVLRRIMKPISKRFKKKKNLSTIKISSNRNNWWRNSTEEWKNLCVF